MLTVSNERASYQHRWARLLKQQSTIRYRLSFADQGKQTSFCSKNSSLTIPFAENKQKLPFSIMSVFRLRNSGNVETWTWRHGDGDMEIWRHGHGDIKQKTETQPIFLNQFTVCSSCKGKFVVCPIFYEEINGSNPCGNGLSGLAHLWLPLGTLSHGG
jgi:hypothetical protein